MLKFRKCIDVGINCLGTLEHNQRCFSEDLRPNPLQYILCIYFGRMFFNALQMCCKNMGCVVCVKLILDFFEPYAIHCTMNLSKATQVRIQALTPLCGPHSGEKSSFQASAYFPRFAYIFSTQGFCFSPRSLTTENQSHSNSYMDIGFNINCRNFDVNSFLFTFACAFRLKCQQHSRCTHPDITVLIAFDIALSPYVMTLMSFFVSLQIRKFVAATHMIQQFRQSVSQI